MTSWGVCLCCHIPSLLRCLDGLEYDRLSSCLLGQKAYFQVRTVSFRRLGDEILSSFMGIVIYTFIRIPFTQPVKNMAANKGLRKFHMCKGYGIYTFHLEHFHNVSSGEISLWAAESVPRCGWWPLISHQSFLLITCSTSHTIPSMTKASCRRSINRGLYFKPFPTSPPPQKKNAIFGCQAIFS